MTVAVGVLTRRRPGHMVDLEQKRGEDSKEENRGLAQPPVQARWKTTGMVGLGFIPNWHERRKTKQKDQATMRSGAGEAQEDPSDVGQLAPSP
jgi:hypothetical protein